MSDRGNSSERDTRFTGYGDRVGSGVELAPTRWKGGELVTDPTIVSKSLKPRRFYYSPIGDGVVAADGIELKPGPVDLTPKVEIIHQRIVEKGPSAQAGRTVTERTWTSGGGGSESQATNQSSYTGAGLPRSAADNLAGLGQSLNSGLSSGAAQTPIQAPKQATPLNNESPFGGLSDPFGLGSTGLGSRTPQSTAPLNNYTKPLSDLATASAPASNYNSLGSRAGTDPYGTLASLRFGPGAYDSLPKSDANGHGPAYDYPASGRSSTTSALFSEPGFRYEIKRDYLVSNPRELIHQFATTTPIQTIPGYESLPDGGTTTRMIKKSYSASTEETYAPYPPYAAGPNSVNPNKFVRALRDENLTITQRQANQNLSPLNEKDSTYDQRIEQIRRQTQSISPNPEVDNLTSRLMTNLHTRKY